MYDVIQVLIMLYIFQPKKIVLREITVNIQFSISNLYS